MLTNMSTPYDDPGRNHLVPWNPVPPSIPYETYHTLSPEENPEDYSEEHGEEGREGQKEKRNKEKRRKMRRGQEWPSTPQQLEKWGSSGYVVCCFDLFLTLLPLMFLGKSYPCFLETAPFPRARPNDLGYRCIIPAQFDASMKPADMVSASLCCMRNIFGRETTVGIWI
jgi:hypothetical protein